jgi:NTE family protein
MRKFWRAMAQAHAVSPLQSAPLERWLWGWDMSNSVLWQGLEMTMRLFSPAQLNPFGHNPLWYFLDDLVDPHLLQDPRAPRLFVSATDVESGRAVIFDNQAIDADVLCASACLPFVFPAVRIGERAYWDGGYSGNPPLTPLLQPSPRHLILIRAQPHVRSGVPSTPTEITNRLNEIACQNVLEAELAALPPDVTLTSYNADEALAHLPISSKFNGEEAFLTTLFESGRAAVGTVTRPRTRLARGLESQLS